MTTGNLSRYEIIDHLGTGSMSEVLKARDRHLNRIVAVKKLNPDALGDQRARKRFLREAYLAAQLKHPNLATVYDVFESEANAFITMEYVEGETLADRLHNGPIPVNEALTIARQVVQGLIAAHRRNIIHRDIKPENIKITPTGRVKILDFGLARRIRVKEPGGRGNGQTQSAGNWVTQEGFLVGTAGYAAPEQWAGVAVDERVDVFSSGVLLYEMVSGRAPFTGRSTLEQIAATVYEEPRPLDIGEGIPPGLGDIICKALAKDRNRRFGSASELLEALSDLDPSFIQVVEPGQRHSGLSTLGSGWIRWRSRLYAYGAACLLGILVAVMLRVLAVSPGPGPLPIPPALSPTVPQEILESHRVEERMTVPRDAPKPPPPRGSTGHLADSDDRGDHNLDTELREETISGPSRREGNKIGGIIRKMGGGLKKVGGIFKGGEAKSTTANAQNQKKP